MTLPKTLRSLALSALAFLALAATASAQSTYYVSPKGDNSADGKNPRRALRTVQRAYDLAQPGDTIQLLAGTHSETSAPATTIAADRVRAFAYLYPKDGASAEKRITIKGAPDALVEATPAVKHAFLVRGSYITLEGLRLRGSQRLLTRERALDLSRQMAASKGFDPENPNRMRSDATPEENTIADQTGVMITGAYEAIGNQPSGHHPAHIIVRDCDITEFGKSAINAYRWADYIQVLGNKVYNNCRRNAWGASAINFHDIRGLDENPATKIIIANNRVFENGSEALWAARGKISDGNGIILDYCEAKNYTGRILIQNNLAYRNGGSGINLTRSDNVDVFHNTVYHNVQTPQLAAGRPIDDITPLAPWFELGITRSHGCNIQNNVIYGRAEASALVQNTASESTWSHNLFFRDTPPGGDPERIRTIGEPFIKADPEFADTTDFKPRRGSPAIDAGDDLGVRTDFRAHGPAAKPVRPAGKAPDLGAWEVR